MNAQQLKNAILQDLYSSKDGWNIKELKDVVADSCPISYGIVQQGNHVDGGVPVVRPVDLHTKYVGKVNLKCTSKDISNSYKRTVLNGNEVLLCVRGTTGIVALATEELKGCNVNRGIVPLYFGDDVDKLFIYYQLQAPFVQETIEENTMGSALKQINIKDLRTLKLRVPPLAEQHRIVAKIEELLPKVEEYGKAQDSLNKLNAELPERLKKSILQEAITGRLVPQDPNDEPASVLLDKIRKEKAMLVKEGKLKKKDLEETPIEENEIPFKIPENWEWCKLGTIAALIGGFAFKSHEYTSSGSRVIRISDITENGFIKKNVVRFPFTDKLSQYVILEGDILMAMTGGTVGKSLYVKYLPEETMLLNQRVALIRPNIVFTDYIDYVIKSQHIQGIITEAKNSTNDNISMGDLNNFPIPLPPLAEQKRIVAKIEEVFKEIDKLKK